MFAVTVINMITCAHHTNIYFRFAWRIFFRGSSMRSVERVAMAKVTIEQRMRATGSFFDNPVIFLPLCKKYLFMKASTGIWNK